MHRHHQGRPLDAIRLGVLSRASFPECRGRGGISPRSCWTAAPEGNKIEAGLRIVYINPERITQFTSRKFGEVGAMISNYSAKTEVHVTRRGSAGSSIYCAVSDSEPTGIRLPDGR